MSETPRFSRREAIALGAAAAFLPSVPAARVSAQTDRTAGGAPRRVIFMVSDGMSMGVPSLAEPFSQIVRGRGTVWPELCADVRTSRSLIDMASADSLVTDSAAAACTWATGIRIENGRMNHAPDGRPLNPIGIRARAHGRRVGLVTTTRITHATPAGFVAVVPWREMEDEIADQYLGAVDVLLGGGTVHFDPGKRRDRRDLFTEYANAGYAVWRSRDDLTAGGAPSQVLGVFDPDHLPYTIDRDREEPIRRQVPTLVEMTECALNVLAEAPDGFLLQVEGGRVDHAGHDNDAAAMLWDQLAFDDAIRLVLEFAQDHPDTLVIVTTDHGTANPGLNGMGARYAKSNACFERLAAAQASFGPMRSRLKTLAGDGPLDRAHVIDAMRWGAGLTLRDDQADALLATLQLTGRKAEKLALLGRTLGRHTGIQWTSLEHTADWVPLIALGPGSERFAGFLSNEEVGRRLADVMGLPG